MAPEPGREAAAPPVCPLCRGTPTACLVRHGWTIQECGRCGHRFVPVDDPHGHVASVYGDDYFVGGGAGYPDYRAEADVLRGHGARYGDILRRHLDGGHVLDVGAAAGYILEGITSRGFTGVGLEPNASMVALGRRRGLDLRPGALDAAALPEDPDGTYDVVSMIQVIAHVPDIRTALARAASLTRPGGYWLIETSDRASARARRMGARWHFYSPPSVVHWFTQASLTGLCTSLGFELVEAGRPVKKVGAAHAKEAVRYKLSEAGVPAPLAAPLRLVPDRLTLRYPAGDLMWLLLRRRP